MSSRRFLLSPALAWLCLAVSAGAESPAEDFQERIRPLVEQYCLDCHDGPKAKGDVNLARFETLDTLWSNPKLWEKVAVQLQDRVMPPVRKTQPSEAERGALLEWLRGTLEHPNPAQMPHDPGPALIRRLSRLEYDCTVRDLLGVASRPAAAFPPDGGGGAGFDNNASTLFLPPLLLEKYLAAAEKVVAEARPELLFAAAPSPDMSEDEAARENLSRLASRAFRRPVGSESLARLLSIYTATRQRGESFASAVQLAAKAVLVSPQFLFRIEQAAPGASEPHLVDDYDLATRLSYFLWSSMPDEELFRLASENRLHEPAVLEAQTRRLLADSKARIFAEDFATQWLRTKELHTAVAPAPDKFPHFTPALRESFYEESVLFFQGLLRDNLPITDCLACTYTYANETLAAFYGLTPIEGPEMRRVALTDGTRGGVLSMGGVLALTAYPRRTSPVLRGKWVMEEILGTPPPPPPSDVNTKAVEKSGDGLSFRQRLEQHRADAKCAGCHARMDPLGFGLENYGVIGEWRTEAGHERVDASGQMVGGEKFNGPVELKALLLTRKAEFTRNLVEKMLAYALGRGLEPADWWPVQQITRAVVADGYRAQTLVLGIVQSYPFQYRRPTAKVVSSSAR